jgi:hypothetical protein
MRIWLDDIHPMPSHFDVHCKTAAMANRYIQRGECTFISLDHDLGPEEAGTGYEVAKLIEELTMTGLLKKRIGWVIHSANPVGRANMEAALKNADRYWEENHG